MKASVILFKGKKLSTGEYPLMVRLNDGNKRKHISLGISLPEERWDLKKGCYVDVPIVAGLTKEEKKKVKEDNAAMRGRIADELSKYSSKIRELMRDDKQVSLDSLHTMVEQPVINDYTVLKWLEKIRDDYKAVDNFGQANVYDSARRLLSLFLQGKDIAFDEIDLPFLYRYEHFLKQRRLTKKDKTGKVIETKNLVKDSTVSIYMRTLRAALAKAVKLGYSKRMPFEGYKIPKGKPNKRALSSIELNSILALKRNDDYFNYMLFTYYSVGMNFTDMARLTWDDIRGNEIHYTRQKTHHQMIIPVHPNIRELLNHYKPLTGKSLSITGKNDNYVFPILHKEVHTTEAQRENRIRKILKAFNKELKRFGSEAKVDTVLTSYTLRHTAITNLVRLGITADAIQALAGHKRLSTTENYIKEASQEQKKKAINML